MIPYVAFVVALIMCSNVLMFPAREYRGCVSGHHYITVVT